MISYHRKRHQCPRCFVHLEREREREIYEHTRPEGLAADGILSSAYLVLFSSDFFRFFCKTGCNLFILSCLSLIFLVLRGIVHSRQKNKEKLCFGEGINTREPSTLKHKQRLIMLIPGHISSESLSFLLSCQLLYYNKAEKNVKLSENNAEKGCKICLFT